jgi:hypothetical protein
MGWGRAAPRLAWQWAQKDGCAQRTGAHARPKPTSLSYIYLGYFVCLCVIVCVCHNCGTLCYSFSFGNQTDQGDETEGLEREGLKMERYGKGQIGEGGCEETFHCLSLNWVACRFTVPPAVALSNYISSGILWRIFCQLGHFPGFSLNTIILS